MVLRTAVIVIVRVIRRSLICGDQQSEVAAADYTPPPKMLPHFYNGVDEGRENRATLTLVEYTRAGVKWAGYCKSGVL